MKNCVQTSFHETDRVVLRQSQNDAVASRVVEASSRSALFLGKQAMDVFGGTASIGDEAQGSEVPAALTSLFVA